MVRATDKICGKLDHEITFEMLTFKIEVKKKKVMKTYQRKSSEQITATKSRRRSRYYENTTSHI